MKKTHLLLKSVFQIGFSFALFGFLPNSIIHAQSKQNSIESKGIKERENLNQYRDVKGDSKSTIYRTENLFENLDLQNEIVDKRAKSVKHFQNNNGSVTAQIGGNYHYKDAAGKWQDINLNIEQSNRTGYAFQNIANDAKTFLPLNTQNGILLISEKGKEIKLWNSPSIRFQTEDGNYRNLAAQPNNGLVNGYKIKYPNVYPGISEEFEILNGGGFENNLLINGLNRELRSLLPGSMIAFQQFIPIQSGWLIKDEKGKEINSNSTTKQFSIQINSTNTLYFGNIIVFDNNTTKEEALSIQMTPSKWTTEMKAVFDRSVKQLDYEIKFINGGIEISYLLPADWIKDQSRAFPVTVDPEITFTPPSSNGDIYTPLSNWYGYQRTASLYLANDLNIIGNISKISYNRITAAGAASDVPTKIYMKTTPNTTLSSGVWNSTSYIGSQSPLFDATFNVGSTTGWKELQLSNPFTYDADNLIIMVNSAYGGSGSAKYYNQSSVNANSRQAAKRSDSSDSGEGSLLDVENYISEIRIEYFSTTDCDVIPNTIAITASSPSICPNSSLTLTSTDIPNAGEIVQLWESSIDNGVTWVTMPHTGRSLTLNTQSVPTKYRLTVTCGISAETFTTSEISVGINPPASCYCTPANSTCSGGDNITNVNFLSLDNETTCSTGGYGDFTALPAVVVSKLSTNEINVTVGSNDGAHIAVWIDYNQNGVFENDEYTYIGHGDNETVSESITIPATALSGNTRMRVRSYYSSNSTNSASYYLGLASPACLVPSSYGETEDYTINIIDAVDCAGTPTTPVLSSTTPTICPAKTVVIRAVNENSNSGVENQWQSSVDNGVTWTNLTSASNNVVQINSSRLVLSQQSVETKYRLNVTCTFSTETVTSNEFSVGINPATDCYCTPDPSDCYWGDMITNVSILTLDNTTDCSPAGYGDYTNLPAININKGEVAEISVTIEASFFGQQVAMWIDYNQNGAFEDDEYTYIGVSTGGLLTQELTIPLTALSGTTRMRIRSASTYYIESDPDYFFELINPACDSDFYDGETEDYLINIITPVDCAGTPNTPTLSTIASIICIGNRLTINAVNDNNFTGITNQWQVSVDDGTTWTDLTPTSSNVITINNLKLVLSSQSQSSKYRLKVTCSISNQTVTTDEITVTNKPALECYCINAIPFNCTEGDVITNVSYLTINQNSACSSPNGYTDYRPSITVPDIELEQTFPISVTVGPSGEGWMYESVGVWVDFNQNGLLDSLEGEYFPIGTGLNEVLTGDITIPADAVGGNTLLRVVCTASRYPSNIFACGPNEADENYGEMEDYAINIVRPLSTVIDSVKVSTLGGAPSLINQPGGTLQLVAHVYPSTMNQSVIWSLVNGTGAATISNGLVSATQNGTVWGKAVSVEDPTKMDSILIVITNQDLGIQQFGANDLVVYPNPTKNIVTLQSNSIIGTVDLEIMDVQGKIIISEKISENEFSTGHKINLMNFANGVYILKLSGNSINYKQNIIKQ